MEVSYTYPWWVDALGYGVPLLIALGLLISLLIDGIRNRKEETK